MKKDYNERFFKDGRHKGKKQKHLLLRHLLSGPFIYSGLMIIPLADIIFEVYHRIGFYLYDIPYIDRSKYIKIDRHKLQKLTIMDKINCTYCGYINGWLAYAAKIASETENYWCAIVHEEKYGFEPREHHENFEPREKFA